MFPELVLNSMEPDMPFYDVLPAVVEVLVADEDENRLLVSVDPPLPVHFGEHEGYKARYFELRPRHRNAEFRAGWGVPITVYFGAVITESEPRWDDLQGYDVVSIGYGTLRTRSEVTQ